MNGRNPRCIVKVGTRLKPQAIHDGDRSLQHRLTHSLFDRSKTLFGYLERKTTFLKFLIIFVFFTNENDIVDFIKCCVHMYIKIFFFVIPNHMCVKLAH